MSTIKLGLGVWLAIAGVALTTGCVATNSEGKEDTEVGGESHFLEGCSDRCDNGLECISGACTRRCDARSECRDLDTEASCVGEEERICDLKCERDADCADIGVEGFCTSGVCREVAPKCSDESERHFVGETWECEDGCNTCGCYEDGLRTSLLGCSNSQPPLTVTCEDDDATYELGETWTCSDGCNTCTCTEDGIVQTDLACPPETPKSCDGVHLAGEMFPCDCNTCSYNDDCSMNTTMIDCDPPKTCTDGDTTYQVGEHWNCSDGCNGCSCNEKGQIVSTMVECPRPANCTEGFESHQLGEVWDCSDGCNICECTEAGIASTDAACLYDNCDVDGGLCDEVRPFSEWAECGDQACLCEALERCDDSLYTEEYDFGSNTTRMCGTRENTCLITYFQQGEGAGAEYHCSVPLGRGWCDSNPPDLLAFCTLVERCDDLSAPDCVASDACDWLEESSNGGQTDAGP